MLLPPDPPDTDATIEAVRAAAHTAGLLEGSGALLDVLRVEAGQVRVDRDLPGKRGRLLPETGLEQQAVSYTKGCYLGQEVIARVRTYGSVPHLLRALVLEEGDLADVPAVGEPVLAADGTRLGVWAWSRAHSPVADAPIALAYLGRAHRTPGTVHALAGTSGPLRARVALSPLYHAADDASRAAQQYDRAIRTFAAGETAAALAQLEACLRLDPSYADAYEAIGVILGRAGRFHEAIDFFRRLEEVAPDEPMVHTNLSLYYMKIGDKPTAEAEAAIATQKGFAKLARERGRDFDAAAFTAQQDDADRKDAERKKVMFGQVLSFDPDDPIALFGRGSAQIRLGEHADAAATLARALEVDRNNSAVYLARGRCLEHTGAHDEAVAVYQAGVTVASRKGDLMPLKEMEHRLLLLGASSGP